LTYISKNSRKRDTGLAHKPVWLAIDSIVCLQVYKWVYPSTKTQIWGLGDPQQTAVFDREWWRWRDGCRPSYKSIKTKRYAALCGIMCYTIVLQKPILFF